MQCLSGMNAFTIRDLENLTGVRAHTIRIWEQRYGFLRPQRTDTNIRYYNNEELKKILNISLLNKYGYKISRINQMSEKEINEKLLALSQSEAIQERIINELIQSMVDLDMDSFERVLDQQIRQRGIEKTILELIFPYMERIGVLWLTSHIHPVQEHLVTNIIRQKLLVGTESLPAPLPNAKMVLLFLPEGEFHELGLLYIQYILKNNGIRVYYLGANVPVNDIEIVVKAKSPDFIYVHLTMHATGQIMDRFITKLISKAGTTPIILAGRATQNFEKKLPKGIQQAKSVNDVLSIIGL